VPDDAAVPVVSVHAATKALGARVRMTAGGPVVVVAAVIERGGRLLVTRRLRGTHLAGQWEFPGGKCEDDESHVECLVRELREELGVAAEPGSEILVTEHAYPDRTVRLHFRRCAIAGEPRPILNQEMRWVRRDELGALEFPDADRALIALLSRPPASPS
jgi:mutator protein MutT